MDSKIKAALLGDEAAAAECTAAGIAIPCPFCGETKIVDDELDCYCDKCGAQASTLKLWNRRAPVQTENAEKDKEIERLRAECDAAIACIDSIEDDIDRGSDNDWVREDIAEWRGTQGEV